MLLVQGWNHLKEKLCFSFLFCFRGIKVQMVSIACERAHLKCNGWVFCLCLCSLSVILSIYVFMKRIHVVRRAVLSSTSNSGKTWLVGMKRKPLESVHEYMDRLSTLSLSFVFLGKVSIIPFKGLLLWAVELKWCHVLEEIVWDCYFTLAFLVGGMWSRLSWIWLLFCCAWNHLLK